MRRAVLGLSSLFCLTAACTGAMPDAGATGPVAVSAGTCAHAPGAPGIEDMVADRGAGRLYASSDDRRRAAGGATSGAILVMDARRPDPSRPIAVVRPPSTPFHPHGLGLWTGPDGTQTVMAVNHPAWPSYEGSTVEIFDIAAGGAPVWRRSVKGAWLQRPNDVEPVGPDAFYVTHESDAAAGSAGELWGWATGADRTGAVFYFDGREGRRVADGMTFANSVSVSADGNLLFATSTLSGHLNVYRRDAATGALSDLRRHFIGRGPDNIDRAKDGVLTVAIHPAMLRFLWHAADAARRSPVRVAEITDPGSAEPRVRDVFVSDGASFSAASVAVRMDDQLVLGAVYDDGVAICPVSSN